MSGLEPDGQWRLGISASRSADLARLGLLETHYRVAIGEITRSVLLAGGGIIYGGRLDPDGYTAFMLRELRRYARRDRPLLACLAWDVHRALRPGEVETFGRELGLFGHLVCLDLAGVPLAEMPAEPDHGAPSAVDATTDRTVTAGGRGFAGLRRYMAEQQVGRVFLGGRREGFEGVIPGVVEELLLTLERGQPTYLAGGFGGVTYDVARLLGVQGGDWPIGADGVTDARYAAGLDAVRDLVAAGRYTGLNNGLTETENRWLTMSHRPGEIASLVSRGLSRVLGDQWSAPAG
jgi:SLOG cluster2